MLVNVNNIYTFGVADESRGENLTIVLDICAIDKESAYSKLCEVTATIDFSDNFDVFQILGVDFTNHPLQRQRWLLTILARRMTESQSVDAETPAEYAIS